MNDIVNTQIDITFYPFCRISSTDLNISIVCHAANNLPTEREKIAYMVQSFADILNGRNLPQKRV